MAQLIGRSQWQTSLVAVFLDLPDWVLTSSRGKGDPAYVETTRAPYLKSITYPSLHPALNTRLSFPIARFRSCAPGSTSSPSFSRYPILVRSLTPVSSELDCRKHGPATGSIARHTADAGMMPIEIVFCVITEANNCQLTNLNILVRWLRAKLTAVQSATQSANSNYSRRRYHGKTAYVAPPKTIG